MLPATAAPRPALLRRAASALVVLLAMIVGARFAAAQCGPGAGDCLAPNGTPGCENSDCCLEVCPFVPDCCNLAWDAFCAELADEFCVGLCGATASLDCFSPHLNPACDDAACCGLVCSMDDFCCEQSWDTNCAVLAMLSCPQMPGTCGDPGAGSCFESHPSGACSDAACCAAVCALDPSCCSGAWDFFCVLTATQICIASCPLDCPPGSAFETEPCLLFQNDPCAGSGTPQTLACGQTVCGRIVRNASLGLLDRDVYAVVVTDGDGDGVGRLTIDFTSQFPAFVAVTAPACGPLSFAEAHVQSLLCVPANGSICLPPGTWWLVVAPGTFPNAGGQDVSCGVDNLYVLATQCDDGCGSACGRGAGDCFVANGTPGCEEIDCCEAVCAELPSCCEVVWDLTCALEAFPICGGTPPANDDCDDCTEIGEGDFEFTTLGATTDGPRLPKSCDEGAGLAFERDVWFCYRPTCNAFVTIETCDAADFDTRLALYVGDCDDLTLVACNDDAVQCLQGVTSRIFFAAQCGVDYRIRVGGFGPAAGSGTLSVTCGFGPPCPADCPADLNGSGTVDGADLGLLLAAWGGPGGDLNGDGTTDGADLGLLLAAWGPC